MPLISVASLPNVNSSNDSTCELNYTTLFNNLRLFSALFLVYICVFNEASESCINVIKRMPYQNLTHIARMTNATFIFSTPPLCSYRLTTQRKNSKTSFPMLSFYPF